MNCEPFRTTAGFRILPGFIREQECKKCVFALIDSVRRRQKQAPCAHSSRHMSRRSKIFLLSLLLTTSGVWGCQKDSSSPTTPIPQEQIVYVAMGASDAVGVGAFPLENGYVYKVRDGLQPYAGRVDLDNLGASGERISYIETTELPTAIVRKPDVVTLWAGPNDVGGGVAAVEFEASLGRIFAALRQQSSAIVVMANVPDLTVLPFYQLFPDEDVTPARIQAYNESIARQCAIYGVPFVDLYTDRYAENLEYVAIDGFHPSNAGHAKLAELFLGLILEAME